MRRLLALFALTLGLLGCSKSTPPVAIDDGTSDNVKVSADPKLRYGKPVEHWIKELKNPDDEAASRAAGILADFGPQAVPQLIEAVKDPDEKVTAKALTTLGRIRPPAVKELVAALADDAVAPRIVAVLVNLNTASVPVLATALEDPNVNVRIHAAHALRDIGPAADEARPALFKALTDPEDKIRVSAAEAIVRIGPGLGDEEPLIAALKDKDGVVRGYAAVALGKRGNNALEAAPSLVKLLSDTSEDARAGAAEALGQIRPRDSKPQMTALRAVLKDQSPKVRERAVFSVGQIGSKGESKSLAGELVPDISPLLKDKETGVRRSAAQALGALGKGASKAAPLLAPLLDDREQPTRMAAVMALGRMGDAGVTVLAKAVESPHEDVRKGAMAVLVNSGADASSAVPAVAKMLKDPEDKVRQEAADFLGNVGLPAQSAVPDLAAALSDTNDVVRSHAAIALGKIGAPAVGALTKALKDANADIRTAAAEGLGKIGSGAKSAVPELTSTLKDKNDETRKSAASALASIGPDAKSAAPALAEAAKEKNMPEMRKRCFTALVSIGEPSVPAILAGSKDSNSVYAREIFRVLKDIGKPAVPGLTSALKDNTYPKYIRSSAASILGEIGAVEAVPALKDAAQDPEKDVSLAAQAALKKLANVVGK